MADYYKKKMTSARIESVTFFLFYFTLFLPSKFNNFFVSDTVSVKA